MNDKVLHIIGNEFTRNIQHPDSWWDYRLNIYEQFCLNSIKNQSNKNFVILMSIDWVSEHIQNRIKIILDKSNLKYILRNVKETSISESLKDYSKEYDTIYYTRIDSDDLFHKDVIDIIQKSNYTDRRALIFQKGYCYDCKENRLRHYFMPSPPFSTIIYPMKIFLDEQKQQIYKNFKSHDTLIYAMAYKILPENKFIVNVHDTNRITKYTNNIEMPAKYIEKQEIDADMIDFILKDFNINSNTYKKII